MCNIIVINKGEVEITTPRQYKEYFGRECIGGDEFIDECLCSVDIKNSLNKLGIKYEMHSGDYYIDRIKFDAAKEKKLVNNLEKFRLKLEKKYGV